MTNGNKALFIFGQMVSYQTRMPLHAHIIPHMMKSINPSNPLSTVAVRTKRLGRNSKQSTNKHVIFDLNLLSDSKKFLDPKVSTINLLHSNPVAYTSIDHNDGYKLQFHGSSRGNRGIAGYGFVLLHGRKKIGCKYGYLDRATNNETEYMDLGRGFRGAVFKSFTTLQDAGTTTTSTTTSNKDSESSCIVGKRRNYIDGFTNIAIHNDMGHSQKKNVLASYGSRQNLRDGGLQIQQAAVAKYSSLPNSFTRNNKTENSPSPPGLYTDVEKNKSLHCDRREILQVNLYFDGGSRGNPGIAGAGVFLKLVKIKPMTTDINPAQTVSTHKIRWFCGLNSTNNVAEYTGLLQGLKTLHPLVNDFLKEPNIQNISKYVDIQVFGDSKLVIQQMQGLWQVKNINLQVLYSSCMDVIRAIQQTGHVDIQFEHIYRNHNIIADELANEAMDERKSWTTIEKSLE